MFYLGFGIIEVYWGIFKTKFRSNVVILYSDNIVKGGKVKNI